MDTRLALYPKTARAIVRQVESQWLGEDIGSPRIKRHIENGCLVIEREGAEFPLIISAQTLEGVTREIKWDISVRGKDPEGSEDILEPWVMGEEEEELVIRICQKGNPGEQVFILGAYDKANEMPGMPPVRTPLLTRDGHADLYEGNKGTRFIANNRIVIWNPDGTVSVPKIGTAVKTEGGALTTVEAESQEALLHGGFYVIVYPVIKPQATGDVFSSPWMGDKAAQSDDLFHTLALKGSSQPKRVAAISAGQVVGQGGSTDDNPDLTKGTPFIIRMGVTGEVPGYLSVASVAQKSEPTFIVKRAICASCGANAPSEVEKDHQTHRIWEWKGNVFQVPGDFSCAHCGSPHLEPVMYKARVRTRPNGK